MARKTVTTTSSSSKSHSITNTKESTKSQSATQKVLDEALRDKILEGLQGYMTDEQINEYAENLLRPVLNAQLEESQQNYETTKLAKEQEIENIVADLALGIEQQNKAYRQSMADVETAALARGMGRSSYTLSQLANAGDTLARTIQQMTEAKDRQTSQIQQQISQAAQFNTATQGRVNTDYAKQLAAKVEEMRQQQRQEYNQNYLTAISAAMGSKTEGSSESTGRSETTSTGSSYSVSTTKSSGGGGKSPLPGNNG